MKIFHSNVTNKRNVALDQKERDEKFVVPEDVGLFVGSVGTPPVVGLFVGTVGTTSVVLF